MHKSQLNNWDMVKFLMVIVSLSDNLQLFNKTHETYFHSSLRFDVLPRHITSQHYLWEN